MSEAVVAETTVPNRRQRRRTETIEEILELAVEQMAAEGVAALSLSTVARRMGIRPPSLYQYFPSKLAVYDALFEQGNRWLLDTLAETEAAADDPIAQLRATCVAIGRWSQEHPLHAELMFWRPVPGFVPSQASFALAEEHMRILHDALERAVAAGALAPAAAGPDGMALFTSMVAGVISQQLANDPDAPVGEGRFARLMPVVFDMFLKYYAPTTSRKGKR